MEVILALIVIGITIVAFVDGGYHDTENTINSKNNAIKSNAFTYTQYSKSGKIRQKRLVSNGEKVKVVNGEIRDMNNRVIGNIKDMERERGQEHVNFLCNLEKYDFYPIYISSREYTAKNGYKIPCVEKATGRKFVWYPCYPWTRGGKGSHLYKNPDLKEGKALYYRVYCNEQGLYIDVPRLMSEPYYFQKHGDIEKAIHGILKESWEAARITIL